MQTTSSGCGRRLDDPSPWVARFAALVPRGGRVLDIAAGGGRHSLLFADLGCRVTAVDRDTSLLPQRPEIEIVTSDLEDGSPWPLGGRRFSGIVVTNYLHRPLLPLLIGALGEGGVLIYETFALGNERFGRPTNPDFLLRPGELLEAVHGSLSVVAYEWGEVDRPKRAVVERLCARRADTPARLPD